MQCIASLPNWSQVPCECLIVAISDDWRNASHITELDASLSGLLSKLLESGDIIYVEPIRRPVSEGLQANSALFSIVTLVITLVAILTR